MLLTPDVVILLLIIVQKQLINDDKIRRYFLQPSTMLYRAKDWQPFFFQFAYAADAFCGCLLQMPFNGVLYGVHIWGSYLVRRFDVHQ